VEFEDRLSISVSKNKATHCKKSRLENREVLKKKSNVFKDRPNFFRAPSFSNSRVRRFNSRHIEANQSFQHGLGHGQKKKSWSWFQVGFY
jgi:hypothetical protein